MTSFPDHSHRPPRPATRSTVPAIWDAQHLAQFLQAARVLRLYPALHLVAHTGMRRGEVASLN
jgi:integrase